jgi:hypothetical protein
MLRSIAAKIINNGIEDAQRTGSIPPDVRLNFIIETPREEGFGDYSTNASLPPS